jgi:hypothetical protein
MIVIALSSEKCTIVCLPSHKIKYRRPLDYITQTCDKLSLQFLELKIHSSVLRFMQCHVATWHQHF